MRKLINNPNFSEIRRVLYKSSSAVVKTLIKTSSSAISDPDFIETDFKYFQDKLEFLNPDILNYLVNSDKSNIGYNRLEKYLITLFPTNAKESQADKTEYFGTYIDNKGTEYLTLLVPEGVTSMSMYEGDELSEAIILEFTEEEVNFSKVIWLITSYDSGTRNINLSWTAYKGDKNPNVKMSDYVLRNDSLISDFSGICKSDDYIYSSISGSLIGTEKLESRPIYDLLSFAWNSGKTYSRNDVVRVKGIEYKSLRSNNSNNYPPASNSWWVKVKVLDWNKRVRYSIGDLVSLGGKTYESVESNNIGNHPYYSRMWFRNDN